MKLSIQPTLVISLALLFAGSCSQGATQRPAGTGTERGAAGRAPGIAGSEATPDTPIIIGEGTPTSNGPQDDGSLRVHIKDLKEMTIQIITLACAGDCADVRAVASGGNPPYMFAWEDGSSDPQRHVCLDQAQSLSVSATDTTIVSEEFAHEAMTVSTMVSAQVLQCADTPPFCIENPSLEGTPSIGIGTPDSVPPDWTVCLNTPDIGPLLATLMPQDGMSYLAISTFADAQEIAGGQFCAPVTPGVALPFQVDLTLSSVYGVGESKLEIWGGMTSCGRDELLWASPPITQVDLWQTYCGTLTPSQPYPFFSVVPAPPPGVATSYLLLDNFRAASGCL